MKRRPPNPKGNDPAILQKGTIRYPKNRVIEQFPPLERVYNNRRKQKPMQRHYAERNLTWWSNNWRGDMDFLDKIKSFLVGVDLTTELIPSGTVFDLAEAAGVNRNIARTRLARLWRKGEIRRFKEHKQQFGVWFVLDKVPFHPHRASVTYREINRDEVIDLWKSSMKHIKSC